MRLLTVFLFVVFFSNARAQTFKDYLREAYFCESDSCAKSFFEKARSYSQNDTADAWYHYFKFFYHIKTERLDSADYYYGISQPKIEKLKDWKLYFNSVDARANTLEDRGLFKQAVQELKEGINKSIALGTAQYTAMLFPRLSYSYHEMGLFEEGVSAGKEAISLLDTTTVYMPDLMSAINAVAINFDDWGKYDSALYYHYLNLELGLEHTSVNSAASTLNNIGNTYMKMDQLDSAEHYFIKSLAISKPTGRTNLLATVLTNLGDINLRKENLDQAKFFLDSALHYAELDLLAPLEKRRDVYLILSKYYQKRGDMSSAFKYQSQYYLYRDSMHNLEQIEEIKNLQLKAATAEHDKKLAQADAQLKSRNLWIIAISALLIITIILLRQFYLKRQRIAQEAKLKLPEERLRISRDLHDHIGAELTYISSVIDQRVFRLKDPEAKKEYELLSTSSRIAMSQLRETIWAIKTDEITIGKFTNKLNELSQKYTSGLGLSIVIRNSGEDYLLAPAKVINLFRVCQEAINNAIKHSGSSHIIIDINAEDYKLELSISDNGMGFNFPTTKTGYGLQNMRERVEEIDGTFDITSNQESGTLINIEVPLPQPRS